jgi:hypothetical protein
MEVTDSSETATRRTYGDNRNVYRVSVGKFEGNRPLGRRRYRWEDNIEFYLNE